MQFDSRPVSLVLSVFTITMGYGIFKIIDKKCSSDKKIFWIGFFLVLTCVYFIGYFIIFFGPFIPKNSYFIESGIANALFLVGLIFSSAMYFLMTKAKLDPPKPAKYELKQSNYEVFNWYLSNRLKLFKYKNILKEEKINIYKKQINKEVYYIIDYKTDEFTNAEYEDLRDNKVFPLIEEDRNKMDKVILSKFVYVIYLISVDRVSNYFNTFLSTFDYDAKYFSLPVGISFGGKKIYMLKEHITFDANEMLRLEEIEPEIKEILEIEDKKKVSE